MEKRYYYLIVNLLIILQLIISITIADGFAYAIDDPYIHLAVAKNLYFNNIWGAVWDNFSGTSSSILFTILNWLLYVFLPTAISEYFPLILNVIAANLLVTLVCKLSAEFKLSLSLQNTFFAMLIVFLPLVANIMNGMEHLWHIFFIGYYIICLKKILNNEEYSQTIFYLTTIFMTASRYEGLFIVAAGFVVLIINRKFKESFLQVFAALLPITIYGIYSMSQGGYFLPNTLLAKGKSLELNFNAVLVLGSRVIEVLMTKKQILPSIVILVFSSLYFVRTKKRVPLLLTIFVALVFFQHIVFADFGWFFRYEAYLIFMSGIVMLMVLHEYQLKQKLNKLIIIIAITVSLPLVYRFIVSVERSNSSSKYFKNVHEKFAMFVESNFDPNTEIMAGDIGTLCFFTKNPLLDVNGLATTEVTNAIRRGYQNSEFLDSLAKSRNVDIAILYKSWEGDLLSNKWKNIGYWHEYNPTAGDHSYFGLYTSDSLKIRNLKRLFENQKE